MFTIPENRYFFPQDLVIRSSLSVLTFVASAILAHSLSNLGKSLAVREAELKFTALQATLVNVRLRIQAVVTVVCHYTKIIKKKTSHL